MKHKPTALVLTATALLLGLTLPFLSAAWQDAALAHQSWPLSNSDAHYAYQGTLMNRVVALNAYLTGSPAVTYRETDPSDTPDELIDSLAAFLPVEGVSLSAASAFLLSPKQYSAEYQYLSLSCTLDRGSLSVTLDTETNLPLRIELLLPPDMLTRWLDEHSLWSILDGYAARLNLGEATDDETNISTILRSQSAQIRGTAYKATVTVVPSTGTLLLKLAASTPA